MGIRTPGSYIGNMYPTYNGDDLAQEVRPFNDYIVNNVYQNREWGNGGSAFGVFKAQHQYELRLANRWPEPPEPEFDVVTSPSFKLSPDVNDDNQLTTWEPQLPIARIPSFTYNEKNYDTLTYGVFGKQQAATSYSPESDTFKYIVLKFKVEASPASGSGDQNFLFMGVLQKKKTHCDVDIGRIQFNKSSDGSLVESYNDDTTTAGRWDGNVGDFKQGTSTSATAPFTNAGSAIQSYPTDNSSSYWGTHSGATQSVDNWKSGHQKQPTVGLDLYNNYNAGDKIPVDFSTNNYWTMRFRSGGNSIPYLNQTTIYWLRIPIPRKGSGDTEVDYWMSMTLGLVSPYKYGYDWGASNDYIKFHIGSRSA
jgi:hypothetical protein